MKTSIEVRVLTSLLKDDRYCPSKRCSCCEKYSSCDIIKAAKRLVSAGVGVPHNTNYDVGNTVYLLVPYTPKIYKCVIKEIVWGPYGSSNKKRKFLRLEYSKNKHIFYCGEEDFGKTVFFCQEDAEDVVASWQANGLR